MKHVLSISLGSSSRDKRTVLRLGQETIRVERIGCDGDEAKAKALFEKYDGQVDAFGIGGVQLSVRINQKEYPLHSGLNLMENVHQTPYTDGGGLKATLERSIFQTVEPQIRAFTHPRKGMITVASDRYGMAQSFERAGFDMVYCDFMFALGLPIPIRSLKRLELAIDNLLPIIGRLPISMLYPTGANQDINLPKYEEWFNYGPVIAGDFLYIRRYMPFDLAGKVIITNTTTESDMRLLQSRGAAYLITTTPRLDGRSFGTNLLEAALIAYAGLGRPLSDGELLNLLHELALRPAIQKLN